MPTSTVYYVDINTSADSITGTGIDISAFNYSQFLTKLALNDETDILNYFYIKGYRNITDTGTTGTTNRWIISKSFTEINSWGTEPWKINVAQDFYFESILDWVRTVSIKNGFIASQSNSLKFSVSQDYINFTFDNCWIRGSINDGLDSRFSGGRVNFINCTLQDFYFQNLNFNDFNFVNTLIYNDTANAYYLIQNSPYTYLAFNNTISNRWIFEPLSAANYNVLNPAGSNFEISSSTNSDSRWDISSPPSVFTSAISAINKEDISYILSAFVLIDITGNTGYTSTWYGGTRDGIGALYFPTISGVAVSGSSATSPIATDLYFTLSGNDPFTVFSASSATYSWDDGSSNSAVNTNSVLTHSFANNGSYQVNATILSFNEWYSVTASSWAVLVGDFNVTITIFDPWNNDITNGQTKPLNRNTFSATINGLSVGSLIWDLGDGLSGTTSPLIQSHTIEGIKSIGISAFAAADSTVSATDTATLLVSATSAEYFVNITSAYDVCANNSGTSADPFNWGEFKNRIETSAEYLDTYRLSGSRTLSGSTSNRYVLKIDRTKRVTVRDWDVSAYGPWVLEVQDFSVSNQNSIISATGSILRNGIIYNRQFSSPPKGGYIFIGTTYDMFIVYQGTYSKIVVEPFSNLLSAGTVITCADAKIIGSTLYLSGSGWQDLFMSADFSGIGQTSYTLEVTDSVITNFENYSTRSDYFCVGVANVVMNNNTFNKSSASISADFGDDFTDCQFDWVPPADYPFTPTNILYGKDIDYIRANKKKLKPFSGITTPPNPGKNYPTYTNYETGLFGYSRKDYSTSGSG